METICAISSGERGAIGVVRVSGSDAVSIAAKIFTPRTPKPLTLAKGYTVHYGTISADGQPLDDVIAIVYRAPHSYTGEDAVELMCHGSSYIQQAIIELLIENGCRMAQPGEYTRRAFLNGKMDLSQAEAVADLISSSSQATHRMAISQMRGGFSAKLSQLRDQLLHMTSLLELEIDFSEEDVEFADRQQLLHLAQSVDTTLATLVDSFRAGNAIKNGIPVAIIGEPNVGKSTLLNQLLHDDRAIVSEVRGTTRDTIEDTITIGGILFRFIDTAGIHHTTDIVESMGIERTRQKVRQAQIIIMMREPGVNYPDVEISEEQYVINVLNKCDKQSQDLTATQPDNLITISALTGLGIQELEQQLLDYARQLQHTDSDIIVTNLRHVEALRLALQSIRKVELQLTDNLTTGDIIALDLHQCIDSLAEITGNITSDDTLHSIFKNFCIGK